MTKWTDGELNLVSDQDTISEFFWHNYVESDFQDFEKCLRTKKISEENNTFNVKKGKFLFLLILRFHQECMRW